MDLKEVWNMIKGTPTAEKAKEPAKSADQKKATEAQHVSAAEQQKQAAVDRAKKPGPAERYLVKNPDLLKKAVDAKAERDKPKPTKHDHVPPSVPKPGPTIQTPSGPMRAAPQNHPPKPVPPAQPRKPTNADRMLDRAKDKLPPKPPLKSYREAHPNAGRGRGR